MYFSSISTLKQNTKHSYHEKNKAEKINTYKEMIKAPLHNSVAYQGTGPELANFDNLVSR